MLNVSGSLALTLQKMLGATRSNRDQPGTTSCSLHKLNLFFWSQASTEYLPFRSTVSWGTINQSLRGLGLKSEASYRPGHHSLPFRNGDFRF